MRIMSRIVAAGVCLFLVSCTGTALAQRVDRNVIYGMYSGLALLMDVHYPETPNGFGVIFVPGSGWNAPLGWNARPLKDSANPQRFLAAGYTVFAVNHRASSRFQYPAPLEDVQRAVRFIRTNAAMYRINPDAIGGFGGSSGGHLVSMLGLQDGRGTPDDPDPVNRSSSRIQAVVAVMAPGDLRKIKTPDGAVAVALLTGGRLNSEGGRYAEASPVTYVSQDDPPVLLIHGDADPVVPFEQSQLMEGALKAAGVQVKLIPVAGGTHAGGFGFKPGDPRAPDMFGEAIKWFDSYLKRP